MSEDPALLPASLRYVGTTGYAVATERSSEGQIKSPSRHDDGNLLPAIFTIDPEMRVKREDAGGGM